MPKRARADKGTKRKKYNGAIDTTGKTGKENIALNAFWKSNKVSDFMTLSNEESNKKIEEWMEGYQERNIKKNKGWWYPSITIPLIKAVNKRTDIDKGWHL
jgi:hypothetical protein